MMDNNDPDLDNLLTFTQQDLIEQDYNLAPPRLTIPGQNSLPGPLMNQFPPSPSSGASPSSYPGQRYIQDLTMELNEGGFLTDPMSGTSELPMIYTPNNNIPSFEDNGQAVFAADLTHLDQTIRRNIEQAGRAQVTAMQQQVKHYFQTWEVLFNLRLGQDEDTSIVGSPARARAGGRNREKFRCRMCSNGHLFRDRGSFRRHVADLHQGPEIYCCHYCDDLSTGRRDKARLHLAQRHGRHMPSRDDLNQMTRNTRGPYDCELCGHRYVSWDKYFECIRGHCLVSTASPTGRSQDDDDGDDDNDDDYNNGGGGGGGGGGWSGYNNTSFTGNSYNPTAPQPFLPQGNGGDYYGTFSGYPSGYGFSRCGANSHKCETPDDHTHSEFASVDSDCPFSCSSSCFSQSAGDTVDPDTRSSIAPGNHPDVFSTLEKVLPQQPTKGVSVLSEALQQPQSRNSTGDTSSGQNTTNGRSILPTKPDQNLSPGEDASKGRCKTCDHQFDGCNKCHLQNQFNDRCHACVDGVGLSESSQAQPSRIQVSGCIASNKQQARPLVYPLPPFNSGDKSTSDVAPPGYQTIDSDCPMTNWMLEKEKTDDVPWRPISHKHVDGNSHIGDHSMSPIPTAASTQQVWGVASWEHWTTDHQLHGKGTGLDLRDIAIHDTALVCPADVPHPCFPGGKFADRLNRSAMLCDPALRMMMPFLFFYGSGFKAGAGQNTLPRAALHGTSYIVQQMQHQQHDTQLLQEAASSVTRLMSNKRSSRLRKKLQVVAQVLGRYAAVANASSDQQAIARKDSFNLKPTGQGSDVVEVGGYGLDAQAFLHRVFEILSFLNAGMTESFASPEHTISKSDDDNEQLVLAFLLHILIVILRIPSGPLLTTAIMT